MDWNEVCSDPTLKNLPYKIELNEFGQVVMSPASIRHVMFQEAIARLLRGRLPGGTVLPEFPVMTADNVKAPDVVWISDGLLARVRDETASPVAPELCVEVASPGNTRKGLLKKKDLYLAAGAREVWICELDGRMGFFGGEGEMSGSELLVGFPALVTLD